MTNCRHTIISVQWIDAEENCGWETYKKKDPWVISTVGYLIELPKNKAEFIVLGNSHLPDTNQWSGVTRIPKGMILSVETISKGVSCGEQYEDFSNTGHPD